MKLQRLRIENFKRFRAPLELRDFTAGLNLFAAPNESGKSTVVEAIRAAFLERHRSSSVAIYALGVTATARQWWSWTLNWAARTTKRPKVFLNKKTLPA